MLALQLLDQTRGAMYEALRAKDWDAVGQLDVQCRQVVEQVLAEGVDQEAVRASMQSMLALYNDLVATCQQEKLRVGGELLQLNQAKQAAKVYQFSNS